MNRAHLALAGLAMASFMVLGVAATGSTAAPLDYPPAPTPTATATAPPTASTPPPTAPPTSAPPTVPPTASPTLPVPPNPIRPTRIADGVRVVGLPAAIAASPRLLLRQLGRSVGSGQEVTAVSRTNIRLIVQFLLANRLYSTFIKTDGSWYAMGRSRADGAGMLAIPVITLREAGTYPIMVKDTVSKARRFLNLVVS